MEIVEENHNGKVIWWNTGKEICGQLYEEKDFEHLNKNTHK